MPYSVIHVMERSNIKDDTAKLRMAETRGETSSSSSENVDNAAQA